MGGAFLARCNNALRIAKPYCRNTVRRIASPARRAYLRDHIMRNILLLTAAVLFSHSALAVGPADPVQKVMDITVKNWSGDAENWKYIFDEDMLTSLFSKDFVAQYREASKKLTTRRKAARPAIPSATMW